MLDQYKICGALISVYLTVIINCMALKLLSHSVCSYVIKLPIEIISVCLIIFMCSDYAFNMKERIVEKRSAKDQINP